MKFFKKIIIFILLGLFSIILINIATPKGTKNTVESISVDRYVVENQNSSELYISTVAIKPNIDLQDGDVISKVFDEIKYFLSVETTSHLGFILIKDLDNELELFADKQNNLMYFEDNKDFLDSDCDYFISKLMKHTDWNVE